MALNSWDYDDLYFGDIYLEDEFLDEITQDGRAADAAKQELPDWSDALDELSELKNREENL